MADAEQEREGMTYRNRQLLNILHDCPCAAQFPHNCADRNGCDPAHSDEQKWGRGFSHKSHDFAVAAMCNPAHMMLDTFDRETKQAEWLRAYIKTWLYIWENGLVMINKHPRAA